MTYPIFVIGAAIYSYAVQTQVDISLSWRNFTPNIESENYDLKEWSSSDYDIRVETLLY